MNMIWVYATVALNICAQIVLKTSWAIRLPNFLTFNPMVLVAIALYGAGFLTWTKALRVLPVSFAYPFMSLTTLIVPILGYWLLGERLSAAQWLFLCLIFIGVVGFAMSGEKNALQI